MRAGAAWLSVLLVSVGAGAWADGAAPWRVGVFDVRRFGGLGASAAGFMKVFDGLAGYQAELVEDLTPAGLHRFDIVVLYDMHKPGRVGTKWAENLRQFVAAGGSVLAIYHEHVFGEVGVGVLKVARRRVRPVGGGPLVEGLEAFQPAFGDYIVLKVGPAGEVFLEDAEGRPVGAFGQVGKGKVIACGLALGVRRAWSSSKPPVGAERRLLVNMLQWLQPKVRWYQRLREVVRAPIVRVYPQARYVRQPHPVEIHVSALLPEKAPVEARIELLAGGKRVVRREPMDERQMGPAAVWEVRGAAAVSTEGLPSGDGHVKCAVAVGQVSKTIEATVKLVRASVPARELRGFWTHAFADRLPAEIMPRIRACGFNAVFPRVSGGTAAFYLSRVLPDIRNILGDKDWMEECARQAHANGLKVYPYRNCFIMEGRASKETIAKFRAAGRLQVGPHGEPIDWMCPSQEINRQVELAAARELVSRYDVDGFQFDFIRYPSQQGCFCPKCRAKFEKQLGRRVRNWPDDVVEGGKLFEEYTRFRQQQITETVAMVSSAIRRIKPGIKISAAVFRDYAADSVKVGQDWVTWAKKGYVDFLCPMDYTSDPEQLDEWVRDQVRRVGRMVPVCAGLGLAAGATRMNSPYELALQVDIARAAGARGFVLFCWYPGCDKKIVLPIRHDALAGTPPPPW